MSSCVMGSDGDEKRARQPGRIYIASFPATDGPYVRQRTARIYVTKKDGFAIGVYKLQNVRRKGASWKGWLLSEVSCLVPTWAVVYFEVVSSTR